MYHWYPKNSKETKKGYCKTACGRDGYAAGGLITGFFKMIKIKNRCKTCNKAFLLENQKGEQ